MAGKSLATFGRRMGGRAIDFERGVNRLKKTAAQAISESVITHTPVKTGEARGGWIAGSSPAIGTIANPDKGGSFTIAMNNARIKRSQPGEPIYIVNNVGHIGLLNDGHSKQQPAGFVERAIRTGHRVLHSARSVWSK